MRFNPLAVLIPMTAVLGTACSDSSTPTSPNPATVTTPNLGKSATTCSPIIDGKLTAGEWDCAATIPFRVMLPSTVGAVPATAYVAHDRDYLYLAVTFDRQSAFHTNDIIAFEFDNDNDGIREDGDDIISSGPSIAQNLPSIGGDYYRFNGGAANQSDVAGGGTNDVLTAWGTVGTKGVFEIRHPLKSGDVGHDFQIDPSVSPVTVGMITQVSLETDPVGSNVYVHTFKPSETTYCKLTIAKKSTSVSCP